MFANNVPGIKIHGDTSVLNAQKVVSMILFFRIVERFVRLLITKFKFYLSDTSISQPLHVLVHVWMDMFLTQQQTSVKNAT